MAHEVDGAFHAHSGWFFQREPAERLATPGYVRITHVNVDGDPITVEFDPNTWASIVAFVSTEGDTGRMHDRALELHQGLQPAAAGDIDNPPELLKYFAYSHLPEHLQLVSAPLGTMAEIMVRRLPRGIELEAGLRRLLEAKDCFVRAALDQDNV